MELKPCPCGKCRTRAEFAQVFDMHIWGDDCPYECEEYENWAWRKTVNRRVGEGEKE